MNFFRLVPAAALITATGCVQDIPETNVPAPFTGPAEQACLAAVSRTANTGEVVLIGSEFSQAGTFVRVGVGPDRAPWKCIAYDDGSTAGVEYMGMNG